jgi:exodeoxyribonuclease VII large subunit
MSQISLNLAPERKIWKVAELTAAIRDLLAREYTDISVEGEISNLRQAQSRHIYFTLKDARAQLRCVCFANAAARLRFRPEDGLHVTVRGSITLYDARGEYQLSVASIEPVGLGALQLAFEQLKQKLAAEGLFDAARKKPLPVLPRRVGIVTSPSGAAVRDVLRILARRFPNLHVIVFPVRVQGEGAREEIVAALRYFNRKQLVDVILLVRGGGSLEDLWPFNEEEVARAVAASTIPVISGVGHETDFTIADFAADVRASTPSNAAEIVVRSRAELESQIAHLRQRLAQQARFLLSDGRHRLRDLLDRPGFRALEELLRQRQQRVDELAGQLAARLDAALARARQRLAVAQARVLAFDFRGRMAAQSERLKRLSAALEQRMALALERRREALRRLMLQLDERSPLRVLERGYAIATTAAGDVIRDAAQAAVDEEISLRLHRGRLAARVTRRTPHEE